MKIIIDVQKLYDEMNTFHNDDYDFLDHESFGEYIKDCLNDLLINKKYPEWAEKKTATRSSKMDGGYTPDFEIFWSHYPKKIGKGLAFESWKKLTKQIDALDHKCQIALTWQKSLWAKDNNKYVPNPENYLKGRRWEDEPPAQQKVERYLTPDGVWKER